MAKAVRIIDAVLALLAVAASFGAAASSATNVDAAVAVPCGVAMRQSLPPPGESVTLRVGDSGLLTVNEHGQDLVADGGEIVEIATPPRLGRSSVQLREPGVVHVRRARPSAAHGSMEISFDCMPDDRTRQLLEWQARVEALEKRIATPQSAQAFDALAPDLDAIRAGAPPGYSTALAQHLRAQALLMTGRSADAAEAFASAKTAWLAIGDRERALAALVAEAEDAQRAGDYAKVLTLTRSLGDAPDREHYFGVRLENSRCLAFEYLARLDEASACFGWTVRALSDLGEDLERISTQQDYGLLELDRGEPTHAQALADDALAAISAPQWDRIEGPDVPIVRGRIERLLSDIAIRRGDIAESLRHSERALAEFRHAQHLRWQANELLRLSVTYRNIGAYADATDAVDIALKRLSARDAPARIAAAEVAKARIAQDSGDAAQAAEHAANARAMFDSLQMPADEAAAALTLAEAKLAEGLPRDARAMVDAIKMIPPAQASRAELVNAEIAVAVGEGNAVDIAALQSAPRPLSEWLRVQAVVAGRLSAQGRHDAALRVLDLAAQHVGDLAARARNPVLRLALERRQRQLLVAAMPVIVSGVSMADRVETLWRWLLRSELAPSRSESAAPVAPTDDFDRALAASLLPRAASSDKPNPDDRLQQHLLELVSAASAAPERTAGARNGKLSVSRLQTALPPDAALLAVLADDASATLVYVSKSEAELFELPDADALQVAARRLRESVAGDERLGAIEGASSELSSSLLGALKGLPLPRRLWIMAPAPFDAVPWPMLTWPGAVEPLIATTSVSFVVPGERAPRANAQPIRLHPFATISAAGTNDLAGLAAAGGELSNIEQLRREHGWRLFTADRPERVAVLGALSDPGSWVHLAGHGSSMAEYLGRSGIWLTTTQGSDAELLSWMDVVEHGVRADTVVLNACALGSSPTTSLSASTGFAEATLRAGANDVVAALWPINDTAASLWATTFYTQLPAQPTPEDIADALRESMLRLRASRPWRHPKYWASLIHLTRIDPGMSVSQKQN